MTKEDLISFENSLASLWEKGKINAPLHLSGGNEDQLIEIFKKISKEDYVFSGHRNHYHALLHGCSPSKLMDEILGVSSGTCHGCARSMGFIDASRNFYASAIVGGMCAPAVGVAWALKHKRKEFYKEHYFCDEAQPSVRKVWCFIGDGALDGGYFWEAWQYAVGWDLPITFVIEDNDRATCSSLKDRFGPSLERVGRDKTIHYHYKASWPHVGIGKYVQF